LEGKECIGIELRTTKKKIGAKDFSGGCVYLKWLIDCRTASSNSMGPGMRRAGCAGCDDMVTADDVNYADNQELAG
jgi:hypothetical protein